MTDSMVTPALVDQGDDEDTHTWMTGATITCAKCKHPYVQVRGERCAGRA